MSIHTNKEREKARFMAVDVRTAKVKGKVLLSNLAIDKTLTKSGCGADAKATGDAIAEVRTTATNAINSLREDTNSGMDSLREDISGEIDELSEEISETIDQLREDTKETIQTISLWYEPNISSAKGVCYKNGKVCTVVFDFTTKQNISKDGVPMYADLPKPKDNFVFVAHSMDGTAYWLGIYPTNTASKGLMTTSYVNDIPSGTRLFGAFTYITED